jgi:hypothetical protein
MRTQEEIQKAHDMLVAICLKEVPSPFSGNQEEAFSGLSIAAGVLCWVLEHDHNSVFEKLLADMQQSLEGMGYTLSRRDN